MPIRSSSVANATSPEPMYKYTTPATAVSITFGSAATSAGSNRAMPGCRSFGM